MTDNKFSDIDTFKSVCEKVKKLIDNKKCTLTIQYSFFADFILESKELLKEREIKILATELEPLLTYLLADQERGNNKRLCNFLPFSDDDLNEDILKIFWEKYDIVKEILYSKEIIEVKEIRKSTKNMFLRDISWEINKKIRISDYDKNISLNYATIKLEFAEKSKHFTPIGPFDPFEEIHRITFDCHKLDLENFKKELARIQRNLKEIDEKYGTK